MECNGFLNPHFHSCNTYIKAGVEIWDGNVAVGMFAVLYNPRTQKVQIQTYNYNERQRNARANIYGSQRRGIVEFYANTMHNIDNAKFTKDEVEGLTFCLNNIKTAFKRYCKADNRIDGTEKQKINRFIDDMNNQFFNNFGCEGEGTQKESSNTQSYGWVSCDVDNMTNEDMINIAKMLSEQGNPSNGILYKGELYRISNDGENLGMVLQKFSETESESIEVSNNNTPIETVRKMIQMAKMKNADGLTEFINGNFYPVVNKEYYNGIEFVTIVNDNGEERKIKINRLELIQVFNEPPINQ
jgi:hypothetical protein